MKPETKAFVEACERDPYCEDVRGLCHVVRELEKELDALRTQVATPSDAECQTEAETFYANGMLRPLSPKQRILYAYESGMRREYRR